MRLGTAILLLGLASFAALVAVVDQVGCPETEPDPPWALPVLAVLSATGYGGTAIGLFSRLPRDVFGRFLIPPVVSLFALGLVWATGLALAPECLGPGVD